MESRYLIETCYFETNADDALTLIARAQESGNRTIVPNGVYFANVSIEMDTALEAIYYKLEVLS